MGAEDGANVASAESVSSAVLERGQTLTPQEVTVKPRANVRLARIVDCGVWGCAMQGRVAAMAFLQEGQVPEHVALRVLASAAFRRKPDLARYSVPQEEPLDPN